MKRRLEKKFHKQNIDDVMIEISQSSLWRKAIFSLEVGQSLLIGNDSEIPLPPYVQPIFQKRNLSYRVRIVEECPEPFDEGLVIFEFSPSAFPEVKRYSGNNPKVI